MKSKLPILAAAACAIGIVAVGAGQGKFSAFLGHILKDPGRGRHVEGAHGTGEPAALAPRPTAGEEENRPGTSQPARQQFHVPSPLSVSADRWLTEAAANGPRPDGPALMARAAKRLHRQPSVSAEMRQTVKLHGHELVGTGIYLQLGDGDDKLLRLEMRMQTGSESATLTQVANGRFLWIRRELPNKGGNIFGWVDLKRLRAACPQDEDADDGVSSRPLLALGGLPRLLFQLERHMQFDSPRGATLGDYPVAVLHGRWKPASLARLMPDRKEAILGGETVELDELPPHVPRAVQVVLGRDNLFPYRIDFLRTADQNENGAGGPDAEYILSRLEMFRVNIGAPLDPLQFVFRPDDREVRDLTDAYIKRMGWNEEQ